MRPPCSAGTRKGTPAPRRNHLSVPAPVGHAPRQAGVPRARALRIRAAHAPARIGGEWAGAGTLLQVGRLGRSGRPGQTAEHAGCDARASTRRSRFPRRLRAVCHRRLRRHQLRARRAVGADRQRRHLAVARAAADDRLLRPRVADAAGRRALAARFAVQFLAHDQEELAARFASKLPEAEKFDGVAWSRALRRAGAGRLPRRAWPASCASCCPGGDHLIAIGEVVDLWTRRGRAARLLPRRLLGADRAESPRRRRSTRRCEPLRRPSAVCRLQSPVTDSCRLEQCPDTCAARTANATISSAASVMTPISRRTIRSAIAALLAGRQRLEVDALGNLALGGARPACPPRTGSRAAAPTRTCSGSGPWPRGRSAAAARPGAPAATTEPWAARSSVPEADRRPVARPRRPLPRRPRRGSATSTATPTTRWTSATPLRRPRERRGTAWHGKFATESTM